MHLAAKALSQEKKSEEPDVTNEVPQESTSKPRSEAALEQNEETSEEAPIPTEDKDMNAEVTILKSSKSDTVDGPSRTADGISAKLSELKSDSPVCQSTESSLSISSLTDSLKPMESSADTLTMVSPLEEVPAAETKPEVIEELRNVQEQVTLPDPSKTNDDIVKDAEVKSDDSSVEVIGSSSEEEIKTKMKGDLVVVGSGVSSDRTTPASSESSNKGKDI